jgi:hypothetical protein
VPPAAGAEARDSDLQRSESKESGRNPMSESARPSQHIRVSASESARSPAETPEPTRSIHQPRDSKICSWVRLVYFHRATCSQRAEPPTHSPQRKADACRNARGLCRNRTHRRTGRAKTNQGRTGRGLEREGRLGLPVVDGSAMAGESLARLGMQLRARSARPGTLYACDCPGGIARAHAAGRASTRASSGFTSSSTRETSTRVSSG